MKYQRLLKQTVINKLLEKAELGEIEMFQNDSLPFSEEGFLVTNQVAQPDNLCQSLLATADDDFQCAKALYNAYPTLTPLQAVSQQFWDTLAFCDLFPYMQQRWSLKNCEDIYSRISDYYHLKGTGNVLRHWLAGLWWSVYLSVDADNPNDPYELTKILFKNQTLRTRVFGSSRIIQHREAAIGVLSYLRDNEPFITSFEKVGRGLSSYFNKLGAVKQLTYLDRDFFYNETAAHIAEFENYGLEQNDATDN